MLPRLTFGMVQAFFYWNSIGFQRISLVESHYTFINTHANEEKLFLDIQAFSA
jgi:hypothetical protein